MLEELRRISAETVMYGGRDFVTPPERAEKLVELIPNAVGKKFPEEARGFWRERRAGSAFPEKEKSSREDAACGKAALPATASAVRNAATEKKKLLSN